MLEETSDRILSLNCGAITLKNTILVTQVHKVYTLATFGSEIN